MTLRRPDIATIGIVTAHRPAALARCIASYGRNAARFDRQPTFVVCDEATTVTDREVGLAAALVGAADGASDLRYVGARERDEIISRLLESDTVPAEVITFAFTDAEQIGRGTYGANRNLLLWLTYGDPILCVDDDTIGETFRLVDASDEVRVANSVDRSHRDPSEVWPLGAREAEPHGLDGLCHADDLDILGAHGAWLGSGQIAVTISGLLGDCGWGAPSPYLFLDGDSRDRVATSDEAYRASVTSRRILRAVRQPVLSARIDDFMSTFFGLDNRLVPPPFLPVCRGSDRVFAKLVNLCAMGWFAQLPLVLRHEPIETRRFWAGEIGRSAAGLDLSTLVCLLLDAAPSPDRGVASRTDRLRHYGRWLARVGAESAHRFAEQTSIVARSALSRMADDLDARAESDGRSPLWQRDLRAYAAALRRTSERPDVQVPLDLRLGRSLDQAETLTRRILHRYGTLLTYWPDLLAQTAHIDLDHRALVQTGARTRRQ